MEERILLSPPHMSGGERNYINQAFESNWIAPLGPNVDAFEREVAVYVGMNGASAMSSGTAAIHIALLLSGVGAGDYVFCSSLTFVASANPIFYLGAKPVFIDSEEETWNMSPLALSRAMKEADLKGTLPKAVIIVNLYGQSAKMDELIKICNQYDVAIIEDAAESLGSTYKQKKSGSFGMFGVFSFNGNKIITTSGGGMLVSNDLEALEKSKYLATQAKEKASHYQHRVVGYNYRMSNVLAGIGRAQLNVLDERVKARRDVFQRYEQALGHIEGIHFMPELKDTMSNRWLTTLTIDPKVTGVTANDLIESLDRLNIEARHVWKPLHLQPLFQTCDYYPHEEGIDISRQLFKEGICLPSGSNLQVAQQDRVIEELKTILGLKYSVNL